VKELERDARAIFAAAVASADPEKCVRAALAGRSFSRGVQVFGAGKAAVAMARAVESAVSDVGGFVVVPRGAEGTLRFLEVLTGGHPLPDGTSAAAADRMLREAASGPSLFLFSGGASALLAAPGEGVTLEDKRRATDLLLRAGAKIGELNCVRKHISRVKGGRLARASGGNGMTAFYLSDVPGDALDVIASGPTAPDPTRYADARDVLRQRELWERVPASVRAHLEREADETPKPGDRVFDRVENRVVGNNQRALEGAATEARRRGYRTEIVPSVLEGEASMAGRQLARQAGDLEGGSCLLAGGETTVVVRGSGEGGRNQELVLAALLELRGADGICVLAAGTDGRDGNTPAAGACVMSGDAPEEAEDFLRNNDSHGYFRRQGGLVMTGPTGTNVMDVVVILKDR